MVGGSGLLVVVAEVRNTAEKIARAFKAKGFSLGGVGTRGGGGGSKPPDPTPPEDLYDDPTHLEGPETVEAAFGKVKGIHFKLNARDGFISRRATPRVTCDHPDIGPSEITVGELRSGRFRVAIAVPESADLGNYKLEIELDDWARSSGGLGPRFEWTTKIEVVDDITPRPPAPNPGGGKRCLRGGVTALCQCWVLDSGEFYDVPDAISPQGRRRDS